jgi:hypothetical protein
MVPRANGPATKLDDLYLTLRPEPLLDPAEFRAYYRPQVNAVRGEDAVARLSLNFNSRLGQCRSKRFSWGTPALANRPR